MTDSNNTIAQSKRRGLGRGLDALFDDTEVRAAAPALDHSPTRAPQGGVPPMLSAGRVMLPITALRPGQFQPRQHFDEDTIHALAQSIAQHGIIQPLLVRPVKDAANQYEIVAGERRWRAAQKAGMHDVPVVIDAQMSDSAALQAALIENLQREDLNPFDEAAGYQKMIDTLGVTPERVGEMIGKSRAHVANMLRLLSLDATTQEIVTRFKLSAGHARALVGVAQAQGLAIVAAEKGLSVRQLEKMAGQLRGKPGRGGGGNSSGRSAPAPKPGDPRYGTELHIAGLEHDLAIALGLKVLINVAPGRKSGVVTVHYSDLDQLDLVIARLKGERGF